MNVEDDDTLSTLQFETHNPQLLRRPKDDLAVLLLSKHETGHSGA